MTAKISLIGRIKALLGASGKPERAEHDTAAYAGGMSSDEGRRATAIANPSKRNAYMGYPGGMYDSGISYRSWSQKVDHWKGELHAPSNLR